MVAIIISSILLLVFLESTSSLTQSQIGAIDDLIEKEFIPANNIPGFALTIVHGEESLAKGYGFRNLEELQLANNETLFGIGSVSKSFTALVVIRVLSNAFPELGESVLDVPIRELIPQYNFIMIDRFRSENTNFGDLLAHRSCTLPESWGLYTWPYETKDEYIFRKRYSISICQFRTEFVYNDGLIQVAGELAGVIANKSFEELLDELFLDIGMPKSRIVLESDDLESIPMLSKPYYRQDGISKRFNMELIKTVVPAPGSGGILSTPSEFVKYLNFHLHNGHNGTHQIIPSSVMYWLRNIKNVLPFEFISNSPQVIYGELGYGLGVFVGTYDGYLKVGHGGNLGPYMSLMTLVPELNIGIVTNFNGPGFALGSNISQDELHFNILNIIRDVTSSSTHKVGPTMLNYERQKPDPRMSQFLPHPHKDSSTVELKTDNAIENDIVGLYGHPASGEFHVTRHNATAFYFEYGRFGQGWLLQRDMTDIYELTWDSDVYQKFLADYGTVPVILVDFTDPIVAYLIGLGNPHPFYRDESLETLPLQPWLPGSC